MRRGRKGNLPTASPMDFRLGHAAREAAGKPARLEKIETGAVPVAVGEGKGSKYISTLSRRPL